MNQLKGVTQIHRSSTGKVRPRVPCVSRVCPGSPRCLFTGTKDFKDSKNSANEFHQGFDDPPSCGRPRARAPALG